MNKFLQAITDTLGLIPKSEVERTIQEVNQSLKGVPQKDRPLQRSSSVIGIEMAPDMKESEYLDAYTGWVFACVRVIAEEVADIKLKLMRRIDQTEFESVDQHPVLDLLYKVNPIYTSYLLWEATAAHIELTGNAYWMLLGPTNAPKEIWILRPDWMTIKDSKKYLIDGFLYGPPGDNRLFIPFENVVHFKDFNPKTIYRGMGTVKASAKDIDEDNFQKDYSRNFFFNSALPAGGLKTENNLTDEQYERIREDWYKVHKGVRKAWQVAILEAGLEWQDIGMTRKDMDFVEGRKLTRDDIMGMFRVPKPLLTFDDVNRAAAKEARSILLENVIDHKMKRLVTFLNEFLLPRYGDDSLFFDYVSPVPNDETADREYYKTAGGGVAWMTPNEIREEEGREPIDGGDQLFIPFALSPLGAQTPEQKALQRINRARNKQFGHFNVRIPTYPFVKFQMDVMRKTFEQKVAKLLTAIVDSRRAREIPTLKELSTGIVEKSDDEIAADPREIRWRSMLKRTDDREARYRHLLNEVLTDQQRRVNQQLDQGLEKSIKDKSDLHTHIKSRIGDIADAVDDDDVAFSPIMNFIASVIETEGIIQIQNLVSNGIFFMQSDEVKKYLLKDGLKFLSAVNDTTADQIREALAEGVGLGESIPELKARIDSIYEDARGYRSERIARSEVLRATNFATDEAYKQSGVVEAKEWLTAHDERTCPWCQPFDGKTIGLDEAYAKKGDTLTATSESGTKIKLDIGVSNVEYPPLHPNCRCTLIPVLKKE